MTDVPDWTAPGGTPADGPPAPPSSPAPPPPWGQPPPQSTWGQPPPQGWGHPPQSPPQWGAQPAGWGGWSATPTAARPGVIPLRPLGVGELLDGAITTIRRYPRATLGLSAVVVTITQLLQFFATRSFVLSFDDGSFDGTGVFGLLISVLLGSLSNVLLSGALTVIIGQAVLGRPISLAEAWAAVRARFWALIGCALLVTLLMGVALVLCIIPFFYAWPALSLATPALMLERQTVGGAISRSQALVRPQFWRCLGVVMLAWLIKSVISGALSAPFALAGGGLGNILDGTYDPDATIGTGYLLLSTLGAIIANTFVLPFSAGVSALLYVDRRMRSEGLDVTLAAAAATGGGRPPG
ncbi:MAG TPA: hypothetical protein VNA14_02865 [Mycobacteriales bacterium]|nr:hypothetical protein [Mycobacteriales bacterium]